MRKLSCFICVFAYFWIAGTVQAVASEGIDSDKSTDLPLSARGVLVATLQSKGTPGTGLLDLANGVRIKSYGDNSDTSCENADEGIVRYNADQHELQYCNGTAWKAAFAGGCDKTCPPASFTTRPSGSARYFGQPLEYKIYVPEGKCGEEYHPSANETIQCIDGAWKYNSGGSGAWYNQDGTQAVPNNM